MAALITPQREYVCVFIILQSNERSLYTETGDSLSCLLSVHFHLVLSGDSYLLSEIVIVNNLNGNDYTFTSVYHDTELLRVSFSGCNE